MVCIITYISSSPVCQSFHLGLEAMPGRGGRPVTRRVTYFMGARSSPTAYNPFAADDTMMSFRA
jgi:hypothetical protein